MHRGQTSVVHHHRNDVPGLDGWQTRKACQTTIHPHAYVVCPSTTGLFAPVAAGTLPGK